MAELVGGAVLQAVFGVLFERLTPRRNPEFLNFIGGKKLDNNLLHRLKPSLNAARAVLNDAEIKQFKDPAVKEWLDDLRDAVYQVEDFMDDVSSIVDTQNQVCNFSSASSLTVQDTDMASKLEDITAKIEFIVAQKDLLGLKTDVEPKILSRRIQSTSRVKVSGVYGRKKEKEAIIELMSDDNDKLSVIPVVGMGGIGKTTLAQLVYNDDYVKRSFDFKAWVCVSEAFDVLKITQTIIKVVSPHHAFDMMDLNLLQIDLEEKLSKKKFLIVLDDIWNDKYTDWDTLMIPFHNGMEGSKILVTTRSERVASMVKTIPTLYRLGLLSDEDCLSLISTHASLPSRDSSSDEWLEKNGRGIVCKCKGLPLAAKALGGLFRSKPVQQWNVILKNDIWDLVDDELIPTLRVSYHYLPPHLKQCIVYCSLFPKDYKFDKEDLVLMWMAEGFLQPSNRGRMTLKEVGYDYFDDLTSRSFFQPSSEVNDCFVMHDLIHDLIISVGGDFFFRLEKEGEGNKISSRTRHLSYFNLNFPSTDDFQFLKRGKAMRTIIGFDSQWPPGSIGNTIMLLDLKYLRTLSFKSFRALKMVPDSIGELISLRYLDLSYTNIVSLPDSLCNLYKLETLKLHGCYKLKKLPNDMQDLVNLRYFVFPVASLEKMPRGMSKLKKLQILSEFMVGREQGSSTIRELGELQNLRNSLTITGLDKIEKSEEAREARMIEKKNIKTLAFSWSSNDCIKDSNVEKDIINKLQPHRNLEQLTIHGYKGTKFPDWVGHCSFNNMTRLWLINCENCWTLPPLGQLPALKELLIDGFKRVVTIGVEFFKGDAFASVIPFVSLECLKISCMDSWESWNSIEMEAFPKLQHLHISECPKLTGDLPCQLSSLDTLIIDQCPMLASSVPRCSNIRYLKISRSKNVVLHEQDLPPSLHNLEISGDGMLESVFESMVHCEFLHLKELKFSDCTNVMSLLVVHIPKSVKKLSITNCKQVEFPEQQCHMSLEVLSITTSCDTLTSIPIQIFPFLNHLKIHGCENLFSVLVSNTPLQNLHRISLSDCKNLKWLSDDTEYLLPNLKSLSIHRCPRVEPFTNGFLPSSLTELEIEHCDELLIRQREWHLPNLTSLTIWGGNDIVTCFPEGSSQLPATLTTLNLFYISSLYTLNCHALQHLTSLQQLTVSGCPKLQKLTAEMLPSSLRKLIIWKCDLLEGWCSKKNEEIRPKISTFQQSGHLI